MTDEPCVAKAFLVFSGAERKIVLLSGNRSKTSYYIYLSGYGIWQS